MSEPIDGLLTSYETGRISRRELLGSLTALAAAPAAVQAQNDTLQAKSLNHVSLIVSDVDRSVGFYQRVFGMGVASRQSNGINLRAGDAFVGLYQAPPQGRPHINHLCLGLDRFDPDRVLGALRSAGVAGESRVRDGVAQVYCADPDGLRVQLQDVTFCGGLGSLGELCE